MPKFVVFTGVTVLDRPHWVPMAEQAVSVIYKLAESPDEICEELLKKLSHIVINYGRPAAAAADVTADEGFESQVGVPSKLHSCTTTRLTSWSKSCLTCLNIMFV